MFEVVGPQAGPEAVEPQAQAQEQAQAEAGPEAGAQAGPAAGAQAGPQAGEQAQAQEQEQEQAVVEAVVVEGVTVDEARLAVLLPATVQRQGLAHDQIGVLPLPSGASVSHILSEQQQLPNLSQS